MSLNQLPAKDNYRREVRTEWGGLNLNENAGDGELIEALNMSSREYPLLATAFAPKLVYQENSAYAPVMVGGKLHYVVEKTDGYYIRQEGYATDKKLNLAELDLPKVRYAVLGTRLVIMPAKQVYNVADHSVTNMESTFSSGNSTVYFQDGTIGGVPADANTIYCSGANWANYFSVGDGVTISGSGLAENNKTAIIREISGNYLRFSENCFTTESYWHLYLEEELPVGSYYFYTDSSTWYGFTLTAAIPAGVMLEKHGGNIKYQVGTAAPVTIATYTGGTPSGTQLAFLPPADADHVTIARTVPDMDFVCVNENRVWGCKGDAIYASKLGDPYNWNVFDGLSTDSWEVETGAAGIEGKFTGCTSYQSYPIFFKANTIVRIVGDNPQNFTLRQINNTYGVTPGDDLTIVEVAGKLLYSSPVGIVQWTGADTPMIISSPIEQDYHKWHADPLESDTTYGRAGTDGLRYYICQTYLAGWIEPGAFYNEFRIMVYDTRYGTWHELLHPDYDTNTFFAWNGLTLYILWTDTDENNNDVRNFYELTGPRDINTAQPWKVTFADSTRAYKTALTGSESKKGVLRLLIRCKLAGSMKVWISYDGGEFEQVAEFGGEDGLPKTSRVVPLILRRCDFWQLRLTGTGDAVIYSIAVEKYGGEWQQA